MTRDVGGMGHKDFGKLCDASGLIHNSSYNKDAAGWDVFVEFPLNPHLNIFNKCNSQSIQCFVQVKSTDKNKKSVSVKLSNLKRFCDTPLPCFFFFAEYEGHHNPVSIYLVHFDKDKIFDVLKRLRECEAEGDTRLNKKTMVIKYNDSHKIKAIEGKDLKECIESFIPMGMGEYAKAKMLQLESLGYDETKYKINFKLAGQVDYDSLVMASLGYESKINIKEISGWDNRFGIELEISELSAPTAIISFTDVEPYSDGTITFDDGCERLIFACDYYFSAIAFNAPEKLASYRVKSKHFDMLIGIRSNTTNISFSGYEDVMNVYDLRDAALLMKMLGNYGNTIEVTLRNKDGKETSMKGTNSMHLSDKIKEQIDKAVQLTSQLIQIAVYFRMERSCELNLRNLFTKQKDITILHDVIFQPHSDMTPKLQIPELNQELDNTKQFYVLMGAALLLPNFNVCITAILHGGFTQERDVILFKNYKIDVQSKFYELQPNSLRARVKDNASKLVNKYESEEDIYFVDSLSHKLS